jgi:hypothetical protein
MRRTFDLGAMDCWLLLCVPRFALGAAGGSTRWPRDEVEADLYGRRSRRTTPTTNWKPWN